MLYNIFQALEDLHISVKTSNVKRLWIFRIIALLLWTFAKILIVWVSPEIFIDFFRKSEVQKMKMEKENKYDT